MRAGRRGVCGSRRPGERRCACGNVEGSGLRRPSMSDHYTTDVASVPGFCEKCGERIENCVCTSWWQRFWTMMTYLSNLFDDGGG